MNQVGMTNSFKFLLQLYARGWSWVALIVAALLQIDVDQGYLSSYSLMTGRPEDYVLKHT